MTTLSLGVHHCSMNLQQVIHHNYISYEINNHRHNTGYYLANGIYPKWATLVQSIRCPQTEEKVYFSKKQESYRKDVEMAFGILQARFAIVRQPARGWDRAKLNSIMFACIILHNMIMEDERDDYYQGESDDDEVDPNKSRRARARIYDGPNLPRDQRTGQISMDEYMLRYRMIRSRYANNDLQQDLIKHVWSR
ncbi:uncharacterized protein LOC133711534 [Rosa rugosa]|uniref:uncharacterized protein LOC133711534 n=1 Tax=Rosa rugosa TaxID=74645 RepID=UPI002B400D30|nr:uncharacterized protein LOC133711534 [Rosa rugosa]